jgi:hypothetical protein
MANVNTIAIKQKWLVVDCPRTLRARPALPSSSSKRMFLRVLRRRPATLTVAVPGANKIKNKPISIKVWGRSVTSGASNLTIKMYSGADVTTGTSIATSGAIAVGSTLSSNFYLEAIGVWDSDSDKFQGRFNGHVNGTAVAYTIDSSVTVPAIDPSLETWFLSASGQFSASNAANLCVLDGFQVDAL